MATNHDAAPRAGDNNGLGASWLAGKLGITEAEAAKWLEGAEPTPHCLVDMQTVNELRDFQERVEKGILVTLSAEEKRRVQQAADRCSMPLETYARISLLEQVTTDLKE